MREADVSVTYANNSCDKIKLNLDCIIFEDDMTRLGDLISLSKSLIEELIKACCSLALTIFPSGGKIDIEATSNTGNM